MRTKKQANKEKSKQPTKQQTTWNKIRDTNIQIIINEHDTYTDILMTVDKLCWQV